MESTPMEGGGDVNWRWRVGAEGASFLARASVTVNAYVADRQFSGVGGSASAVQRGSGARHDRRRPVRRT